MAIGGRRMAAAMLVAAVIAGGTALRWVSPERVQDLHPRPDAVEYEEAARRLARGGGYWLHLGSRRYPPRYPIGFSALLAPGILLWGEDQPGLAVRVVLATAAIAILTTSTIAGLAAGNAAAAGAALLLATAPLHIRLSKAVLADVPSSAAVAGVGLLAMLAAARGARSAMWIAVGVAAGVSATLRIPNVLVLVPATLVLLCACEGTSSDRMRGVVHVAAGALVGLLPLLVQDWWYFGSPFATGYGYWVPESFFGIRYALGLPAGGGTDANVLFYLQALLGKGELYGWPVAALVGAGTFLGMRRAGAPRALAILAVSYVGALYAFQSLFFWQSERFLLPAVPLLIAIAALPLSALAGRVMRLLGVVMLVLAVSGAWSYDLSPPDRDWGEVTALRDLRAHTEGNAVILARTNAFFFERFLRSGADRLWMPLGLCDWQVGILLNRLPSYGTVPDGGWMLDPITAPLKPTTVQRRVRTLLNAGRPVYVSAVRGFDVPFFSQLLDTLRAEFSVAEHAPRGRWAVFEVRLER
jgi:4-amino-4-deoxy-L-arabinose transferase-like glycosyltransferase